jgi:hypothetical protein
MTLLDSHYLEPPSELSLRSGEDYSLEEQAALLLAKGRQGVTALSDKRDYLTKDQLKLRAEREVLNHTGVSDESLMSGLFRRAFNPNAGCRPSRGLYHHEEC